MSNPASIWRILLGLWILASVSFPAEAQQWTGTAVLGLSGGYQTNTYLDPVLHSWDRLTTPTFAALTPQVGLSRKARRTRLDLMARTRLFPDRQNVPQFVQGNARLQYHVSPSWTVGVTGGGTRYRLVSSRNSWWALSSLRWTPFASASFTLRGGVTERYIATTQGVDRQPSGLVTLHVDAWLTDRLRTEGRLYWSNGRTSIADAHFGGTGMALQGTYWPAGEWSLEAKVAVEQLRYEAVPFSSTVREHIGRGGFEIQWNPHPSVRLFAETQALVARLARNDQMDTDLHASAGIRFQVQRVLGNTGELPSRRRICQGIEKGIRIQIPYDGNGTPHLTGDFNDWSLPGIPLTSSGDDVWTAELSLPPGKYAYRIRVVNGSERRWLDLPSYAQTAADSFGGTNGVCTAH